ncbi:MotA/TolQ/ExbB proton channel family protein [Pseudooceanicola sediminis]|uniref:MotA/TolQ/ExbB proton channel family protein n=1 Tax=Pseudooceanicola sediminis TaxID=2211117 RepID=A0A399J3W0_9RHOB|nr:MotA/TolQ/ExbB proton channel family protein [Pseudooceanicola sediminis]KAA2314201.1 MotA/TolQ/ExbB proton channel family protein [Puniceibacterium sp. HSS470]RII39940.1 MotA/TolQ/ExbB proton channel family protein [Pseudooceanicola sediminis]|tara:strand:+ start:105676 stop:106842 length:1167 start_codon:yes stop_codon:yes gene_type:complete
MVRQRLALAGVALFIVAGAAFGQTDPSASLDAAPSDLATSDMAPTDTAPSVGDTMQPMALPGATTDAAPSLPGTMATASTPTAPSAPVETADSATPDAAADTATPEAATPDTAAPEAAPDTASADAAGDAPASELAPVPAATPQPPRTVTAMLNDSLDSAVKFLVDGGPAIWAIAALSIITVALILWKIWRLVLSGAWSRRTSRRAVLAWEQGEAATAIALVEGRGGVRSRLVRAAMRARLGMSDDAAREETTRVARRLLTGQGTALRALELIATIAPLLGLLGTVMGMISAFQALQEAGSQADPALLAGGIWEALLTTAAGMAVAIPASAALTWFEAVLDTLRTDLEDLSARIFIADLPGQGIAQDVGHDLGLGYSRGSHLSKHAAQ